jgi:hypothetical protein
MRNFKSSSKKEEKLQIYERDGTVEVRRKRPPKLLIDNPLTKYIRENKVRKFIN